MILLFSLLVAFAANVSAAGFGVGGGPPKTPPSPSCELTCTTKPGHSCPADEYYELGRSDRLISFHMGATGIKAWEVKDKYRSLSFTGSSQDDNMIKIRTEGEYTGDSTYYIGYMSGNNIDWFKQVRMGDCNLKGWYGYNSFKGVTVREKFGA
jgi:hypothetical protein